MKKFRMWTIVIGLAAATCLIGCQNMKDQIVEKAKTKAQQTVTDKIGYEVKNITPEELDKMKSDADVQLVDVRTEDEVKAGAIDGAKNIPVKNLSSRLSELDKNKKTIVYCQSGGRSQTATGILLNKGFKKVYNLTGGYQSYRAYKRGK